METYAEKHCHSWGGGVGVHAILQARTLEWVAIPVSSSRHREQYMPRSWEKIELGEFQDQKDDWIISS